MVHELQRDGRLSYADLAVKIGISATSAADRFRRLSTDGIIDIVTFVDPPRMGMHLSGAFLIAASGPLRPLMKRLGENKELAFFTALGGEYPGYVAFNCKGEAEYHALRARILATEGVQDVQPLLFSKLYHESVEWGRATGEEPAQASAPTTTARNAGSVSRAPATAHAPS